MTPRLKLAIAFPAALIAIACGSGGGTHTGTVQTAESPSPSPSPSPEKVAPKPADFVLTVKVTEKECFGTAGCNVTFRTGVGYSGAELSPDDEWLVTYEITGGEDGTTVDSFTLRGREVTSSENVLSVKSSKTVIKAKVTEVAAN